MRELLGGYWRTLQADRRVLAEGFEFLDMARKVVGVGSVGTRCWIILMRVRQLADWKGSAAPETMMPDGMAAYGRLCGWTLAHAHARSGDRIAIAAYLGDDTTFANAIAEFSAAYADQNERDHAALVQAERTGRIVVQHGL